MNKIYIFVARESRSDMEVVYTLSDGKGAAQAVHAMSMLQQRFKHGLDRVTTLICEVPTNLDLVHIINYLDDAGIKHSDFKEQGDICDDELYLTAVAVEPLSEMETTFMRYVPLWASNANTK